MFNNNIYWLITFSFEGTIAGLINARSMLKIFLNLDSSASWKRNVNLLPIFLSFKMLSTHPQEITFQSNLQRITRKWTSQSACHLSTWTTMHINNSLSGLKLTGCLALKDFLFTIIPARPPSERSWNIIVMRVFCMSFLGKFRSGSSERKVERKKCIISVRKRLWTTAFIGLKTIRDSSSTSTSMKSSFQGMALTRRCCNAPSKAAIHLNQLTISLAFTLPKTHFSA